MGSFTARRTRCGNVERGDPKWEWVSTLDHGNEALNIQSGAPGDGDSFSVYGSKRTLTMLGCRIVHISKAVVASLATVRARNAAPATDDFFQGSRKQFAAVLAHELKDHGY